MKILKCNEEYLELMVTMPSSSKSQNECLRNDIEQGHPLDQCIIALKNEEVVFRITLFPEIKYLGNLTIENIDENELYELMQQVIKDLDRTIEWRVDLYSDKVHHSIIQKVLRRCFDQEFLRESYTIQTKSIKCIPHTFKSAKQMNTKEILKLLESASETTLDNEIQKNIKEKGLSEALKETYQSLIDDVESESLFQVLCVNNQKVGFVAVNRLLGDIGAIGYIGVAHSSQGMHYGEILLKKAIDIAHKNKINTLIADIDISNFAIRNHLLNTGFTKDCNQSMFFLKRK